MYLCICNALKESQVKGLVSSGVRCEREAYARLGCRPQCGMCIPHARELLRSATSQSA
jgi:bacterioferritin-associated ferredoxin